MTEPAGEGLTFEKVWVMFQETAKRFQETDRQLKESGRRMEENDRRLKESLAETDRVIMEDKVKALALDTGFYVIVQSGDTVKIEAPKGFIPRIW